MKRKILMLFLGIGLLMAIENPIYKLIDKRGDIEIREYQSMIIAVTQVSLPYRSAQSEGFRRIANYIFGGNDSQMEIAMTAPVISTELDGEKETYEVLFIMPREHQIENLP
ncbi:MAG: heme-binding protein, partial [Candidatus Marinimicrobia bacterium]|nr:heme-binding protein [Candidatus Neomarinimicrobiota bacterium]